MEAARPIAQPSAASAARPTRSCSRGRGHGGGGPAREGDRAGPRPGALAAGAETGRLRVARACAATTAPSPWGRAELGIGMGRSSASAAHEPSPARAALRSRTRPPVRPGRRDGIGRQLARRLAIAAVAAADDIRRTTRHRRRTAHAVAETLQRLAGRAQVVTILHLPRSRARRCHPRREGSRRPDSHARIRGTRRRRAQAVRGGSFFVLAVTETQVRDDAFGRWAHRTSPKSVSVVRRPDRPYSGRLSRDSARMAKCPCVPASIPSLHASGGGRRSSSGAFDRATSRSSITPTWTGSRPRSCSSRASVSSSTSPTQRPGAFRIPGRSSSSVAGSA